MTVDDQLFDTTPEATRPGHGWYDPTLLQQTSWGRVRAASLPIAFLALGSLTDLVLIKPVIDSITRVTEQWSWFIAGALAILALFTAFSAGWILKGWLADRRPERFLTAVCLVGWGAIGAALFTLRAAESHLRIASPAFEGTASLPASTNGDAAIWLASIMTLIYLATGAAAFYAGYAMRNDAATALRRAQRRRANAHAASVAEEKHLVRLVNNQAIHNVQYAQLGKDQETAIRAVTSLNNRLKAFARYRIAVELGNPSATGLIRDQDAGSGTGTTPS